MSFRDILVYLDPTPASEIRLEVAIGLARTHGARIIGVDASTDAAFLGVWSKTAIEIGDLFQEAMKAAKLIGQFIGETGRQNAALPDYSHCVDLLIGPRPEGETRDLVQPYVPDEALLRAGAPVLILPQDWKPGPLGENVVIAWNASREATRAVHDAMPILERAQKVVVFAFSHKVSNLRASAEALVEHLARHGVEAIVSDWTNTGEISAVEALYASLDTQDSDLIVAGGFGHSRIFEGLFGGVSLDLLQTPTMPILMSH